jgi:NTE family protein
MNRHQSRGINLVLRGGGVKGIAIVGALAALEQSNVRVDQVGGASAGALIAALCAVGYRASELRELLMDVDFASLLDPYWSRIYGLVFHRGMYKGVRLRKWLDYILARKLGAQQSPVRFADLAMTLKVVTTDLHNSQPIVFTQRATMPFERSSNDLAVAEAVRASCGIPFFFKPYVSERQFLVDGGVLANFPMWLFPQASDLTLGVNLVTRDPLPPQSPSSLPKYVSRVIANLMLAGELASLMTYSNSIIHVEVPAIPLTQFGVTAAQKEEMYQAGFGAAKRFLATNQALLTQCHRE